LNTLTTIHFRLHKNFLLEHQDRLTSTFKSFQQIHTTMRLFLNVLAPFFLLNSFASAANYDLVVQWESAVANACTSGEIASIENTIGIASNSVLAAQNCAQVANWNSAVLNRRQLRERELCGSDCSYTKMCKVGTTCYTNNYCNKCRRREERELLQAERTLGTAEIAALESGLVGACENGLDKEWTKNDKAKDSIYSVTCMAAMKTALDNHLCYSKVFEF
jgi:hypothetical protein